MAELQHAGRGRLGRRWIAPFGASIATVAGLDLQRCGAYLAALSLAVGVGRVARAARAGARGIGLKWPNDIWFEDRKLGGVLIEIARRGRRPGARGDRRRV